MLLPVAYFVRGQSNFDSASLRNSFFTFRFQSKGNRSLVAVTWMAWQNVTCRIGSLPTS